MNRESDLVDEWDLVLSPKKSLFRIQWNDLWRYRDLLYMFVKRDVVTLYKQTVLGPLWIFIQPILTVIVYLVVFGRIARLSTDGLPPMLFYLSGVIVWNFFQESFNTTSKTFTENANLFGKVYFPRLILPLAKIVSGLIRFVIQFGLFLILYAYYIVKGYDLHPTYFLFFLPLMIVNMGLLGLGLGIIFTSLTTKYRDLVFLIQFGIQLVMYATPVIYPLSSVPAKLKFWIDINPMTPVLEGFRLAFLGSGTVSVFSLLMSFAFSIILVLTGIIVFNNVEKDFMDTV
jgi:lipopolysaccharide transport system permease protein